MTHNRHSSGTARRGAVRGLSRRLLLALGAVAMLAPGVVAAQDFPNRAIKLVVPFPPGGMTDLLGRIVAERLSAQYGQPVVVDNRAGVGGHLGAQQVAKAPADGYTLVLGTIGIHAAYGSYSKLGYDPAEDLVPITVLAESPNVVLVPANSELRTFADLLASARSQPGKLNYATAGPGTSVHMVTALFETASSTKVVYVPYKGSGPAMVDLIGGQVQVMFENLPSALPHVAGGKVRALAVTGGARDPRLPEVPTIAEAGVPGYAALSWFTVAAPKGTPQPIVDKLAQDIRTVLSTPEIKARLDKMGASPVLNSPAGAKRFFATETVKWNRVIQATNLKLD